MDMLLPTRTRSALRATVTLGPKVQVFELHRGTRFRKCHLQGVLSEQQFVDCDTVTRLATEGSWTTPSLLPTRTRLH